MAKDMHKERFDEATMDKLKIFGECFEEWLPVFIHDKFTDGIFVFDFFAGSGVDVEGTPGSPLILFDKAKKHCDRIKKSIQFIFCEADNKKSEKLKENIQRFIAGCDSENRCDGCIYTNRWETINGRFREVFADEDILSVMNHTKFAKFILLDQYGFSQIDEDVFRQLVSFPKTDFIFFIASSFISRFREHEYTKKYIDTTKIDFDKMEPKDIHREIANYFRGLIPPGKEYYLHHFSIKKQSNYYGLIFGSNHSLGMEKFLKVCWKHDKFSGEANYNIDNNWEPDSLFHEEGKTIKKGLVKKEIQDKILSGDITDNRSGLKFAMTRGCMPKLFTEAVQELEEKNLIRRTGNLNYSSTKIHNAGLYRIERV